MPQTCLVPLHLSCHHALDFSLGLHDSVNLHMQIAWSVVKQHCFDMCHPQAAMLVQAKTNLLQSLQLQVAARGQMLEYIRADCLL